MHEAKSEPPDSRRPEPDHATEPPRWPQRWERRHWARLALLVFAVGAFFLFSGKAHHRVAVVFEVPPTLYPGGTPVARGELNGLVARFFDADGAHVAHASLWFVGGLDGPLAPPVVVTLPEGRYPVRVEFLADGRDGAPLRGVLEVEEAGTARVELR